GALCARLAAIAWAWGPLTASSQAAHAARPTYVKGDAVTEVVAPAAHVAAGETDEAAHRRNGRRGGRGRRSRCRRGWPLLARAVRHADRVRDDLSTGLGAEVGDERAGDRATLASRQLAAVAWASRRRAASTTVANAARWARRIGKRRVRRAPAGGSPRASQRAFAALHGGGYGRGGGRGVRGAGGHAGSK